MTVREDSKLFGSLLGPKSGSNPGRAVGRSALGDADRSRIKYGWRMLVYSGEEAENHTMHSRPLFCFGPKRDRMTSVPCKCRGTIDAVT